jgi:DNA-binding MarR family transcriptional regulator
VSRVEALRTVVRLSRTLERACGELSLAHYRVLAAVADGDERASLVASRLALGRPTISASVDALCRRGLLTRSPGVGDQRVSTLQLTAAGEAALAEVEAAMLERLDRVLTHTVEAPEVVAGLDRLGAGLDGYLAERRTDRAR